MSRNDAKSIKKVLNALHPQEHQSLEVLITAFHSKFGDYKPKTMELYSAINDNSISLSDAEVKVQICGNTSNDTYFKLMSRLKEKVFENLILDVNIRRKGVYSTPWVKQQQVRKNLIIADLIALRGLVEEAVGLIDRSIREAQKYELYVEIVQLLNAKFNLLLRHNRHKEAEDVERQWLYYSSVAEISSKSYYYFNTTIFGEAKLRGRQYYYQVLDEKIKDLESYSQINDIPIALYYLYIMSIQREEISGNYQIIMRLANDCLKLLEQNPKIARKARYANAFMQLFTANIYLQRFQDAYGYVGKVLEYVNADSKNYLDTLECGYYARFYAADYQHSALELEKMEIMARKILGKNDAYFQKLQLLKAYQFFVERDFSRVAKLLSMSKEGKKEEGEQNLVVRILQIMTLTELGDYDMVDTLAENLRKYVQGLKRQNKVRKRYVLIQSVLIRLVANGLDFKGILEKEKLNIEKLDSWQEEYQWNYFSPEIIPFQNWIRARAAAA